MITNDYSNIKRYNMKIIRIIESIKIHTLFIINKCSICSCNKVTKASTIFGSDLPVYLRARRRCQRQHVTHHYPIFSNDW